MLLFISCSVALVPNGGPVSLLLLLLRCSYQPLRVGGPVPPRHHPARRRRLRLTNGICCCCCTLTMCMCVIRWRCLAGLEVPSRAGTGRSAVEERIWCSSFAFPPHYRSATKKVRYQLCWCSDLPVVAVVLDRGSVNNCRQ